MSVDTMKTTYGMLAGLQDSGDRQLLLHYRREVTIEKRAFENGLSW